MADCVVVENNVKDLAPVVLRKFDYIILYGKLEIKSLYPVMTGISLNLILIILSLVLYSTLSSTPLFTKAPEFWILFS